MAVYREKRKGISVLVRELKECFEKKFPVASALPLGRHLEAADLHGGATQAELIIPLLDDTHGGKLAFLPNDPGRTLIALTSDQPGVESQVVCSETVKDGVVFVEFVRANGLNSGRRKRGSSL